MGNVRFWQRVLLALVGPGLFFGVAAWAWGDVPLFFAHPARLVALLGFVCVVFFRFAAGDSGFSSGKREDRGNRWVFYSLSATILLLPWLPPLSERLSWWTVDGEGARYAGAVIFLLGAAVRTAAVATLRHRFSGLVAIQEQHELQTTGLYSVVRHPAYVGLVAIVAGWALLFRSGPGLILAAAVTALLLVRIGSEERLLASEFGAEYEAYRRRTWRLVPFVF
jgi:protein-S-isoprenylcysteine O-methyltransferase Ste14